MKIHYKILTITLMIISVLFINIPVFADTFTGDSGDEHGGSSGGFGVADGQVTTYDYVKQNPDKFPMYTFEKWTFLDVYNPEISPHFNNMNKTDTSMIWHTLYVDHKGWASTCDICPIKTNYVYAIGLYGSSEPVWQYLGTEYPLILKNNNLYINSKDKFTGIAFDEKYNNVGFGVTLSKVGDITVDGQLWHNLGSTIPSATNSSFFPVLYPINGTIDKIVDGGGNTFANTGEYANLEKGYRQQKNLEQYSKYEPENYPKSTQLKRKTNWIKTPDIAYHDDGITKSGGNKAFKGFYFNKISSPNGPTINILESGRYTYHLYLWRDGKWRPVSIWSTKVLTFKNSVNYGSGYIKPPILSTQTKTYAVILDYETNTLSAVNDDNAFVSGAISNKTPYVITSNSYYIVNDDLAVLSDSSSGNRGSDIFNEFDKDIYDTNGDNQGAGVDNGGTYYPPNRFEPLPKPEMGASIFEWINYFIDNIDKVFSTIGEGIKSIGENVSSFFGLIGSVFSFLPPEVWTILTLGLSIIVILRLLGR